jgi:V8-like Glu-specific endopeptidase
VYKQIYINDPLLPDSKDYLAKSVQEYSMCYQVNPVNYIWQGLNTAALLKRATDDGIDLNLGIKPGKIAADILQSIEEKDEATQNTWDLATAMEASLFTNDPERTLGWANKYIKSPYADAFEIASTLRQMTEVWKLDMNSQVGKELLPVLRSELLKREGGNVTINASEIQPGLEPDVEYGKHLEKVFGFDTFNTYQWYKKGEARCLPVARIGRDSSKGFGTGFLMEGKSLHKKLANEKVLLTNAHVVSRDPVANNGSLTVGEVVVIFEILDPKMEFKVDEVFWTSDINNMDVSVLRFDKASQKKLEALLKKNKVDMYPISTNMPSEVNKDRIYIIGHPNGGTLQLSLQDNTFLAFKDPFIHYRTPTVGGSSGSPVFNSNWELIGVHHAGDEKMEKLGGKKGKYEANEGIWIESVRKGASNDVK